MTTVVINATDSAAIRRDENTPTAFYKIGCTNSPYDQWYYRGLLYFSLAGIPASAKIVSAKIECYLIANLGTVAGTYSAHRITNSWVGAYVTREYRTGSASWSTIGGDFEAATSGATASLSASESGGWKAWVFNSTGITNLENMLKGTTLNYGWLLKNSENDNRAHGFDYATNRPRLTIEYNIAADTGMVMMYF